MMQEAKYKDDDGSFPKLNLFYLENSIKFVNGLIKK
jgi:hypothetical protein